MPTTTDISSFTPAQQTAFKAAEAQSGGKATDTTNPAQAQNAPLMVTSSQSRAQYGTNVSTLQQATGQGMPSATAPGQSTAAQNGGRTGAAPTPPAPEQPDTTKVPAGWDAGTYSSFKAANPTLEPNAQDTANMQASKSGMDLIDPAAKALLQGRIDDLTSQSNAAKAQVDSAMATMNNDPAMQQAADAIKAQFDQLIQAQIDANSISMGRANTSVAAFGGLGVMSQNFLNDQTSRGLAKVADLKAKEDAAILQSNQAYKAGDVKAFNDAMAAYNKVTVDKGNAVKDLLDSAHTAAQDARQAKLDAQAGQDKITAAISNVQMDAAKAGAPAAVLQAISTSNDQTAAIAAAGQYLQASSNPDISQYLFYKNQATAAGQEPVSFDAYQKQQADIATSQASKKAYATAYASATGKAAGEAIATPTPIPDVPGSGLGGTTQGGSILSAAGISIAAFNYLTQGTASMSRMSASQRMQIMGEAEKWLNKNGVDISTFQSQYKAYNETLQKNIMRANQTKIMAGEVSGSADALLSVLAADTGTKQKTTIFGLPMDKAFDNAPQYSGSKLGNLSAANVLDLMAGKQVNSAFAQKYSFQIQTMANDLAGYFSAARGATAPDDSDKLDAANVISNGMNSTSVQAFKESIQANEQKVAGVVNTAVNNSQKQVWNLFGIGGKYANPVNTDDVLLQQNQHDPGNIGEHLNTPTADPTNPAGLAL